MIRLEFIGKLFDQNGAGIEKGGGVFCIIPSGSKEYGAIILIEGRRDLFLYNLSIEGLMLLNKFPAVIANAHDVFQLSMRFFWIRKSTIFSRRRKRAFLALRLP